MPESNEPSRAVTVCGGLSALVQVTVSPAPTFSVDGSYPPEIIFALTFCRPAGADAAASDAEREVEDWDASAAEPAAASDDAPARAEAPPPPAPTTSVPSMPGWKMQ